jgi:ribonuclease T2
MRIVAAGLGGAVLLMLMASRSAHADVAMTGTFTATQTCPAYQSFRKSTDPGDVKVERNKTYAVIAKNKPDASHYRIVVEGAQPEERWVSSSCGRVEPTDRSASGASQSPTAAPLRRATRQARARRTCSP